MKKLMFAVACMAATAGFAEMKTGIVDLMLLVKNHPNYETNKELLSSTDKGYQKKLEVIKADGEKLQKEGQKLAEQLSNPMLAQKAKQDLEKQVMDIQKKLMGIEQNYRSEAMHARQAMQDLEANLLKTTTDDLRKRIAKFAEANGYDLILDSNAAPYAKPEFGVTDALLKEMGVEPANARGRNEGK